MCNVQLFRSSLINLIQHNLTTSDIFLIKLYEKGVTWSYEKDFSSMSRKPRKWEKFFCLLSYELRHEKTCFLHMPKVQNKGADELKFIFSKFPNPIFVSC